MQTLPRLLTAGMAGFTLIEVLVAIGILALMAGLSWRGLDGMVRTQVQIHQRADALLGVQAGLEQWSADLDALLPLPNAPALDWDGRALRLTRRHPHHAADGLVVVAWTRRSVGGTGYWLRWQSPPLHTRQALQTAWLEAALWAQNPGEEQRRYEVSITALDDWKVFYFRANAWSNPLSSDETMLPAPAATASVPNATGQAPPAAAVTWQKLPDGVRLVLTLPEGSPLSGQITRDWARATLGKEPA